MDRNNQNRHTTRYEAVEREKAMLEKDKSNQEKEVENERMKKQKTMKEQAESI